MQTVMQWLKGPSWCRFCCYSGKRFLLTNGSGSPSTQPSIMRVMPSWWRLLVKSLWWEGKWTLSGGRREEWTRVTNLHPPEKHPLTYPHYPGSFCPALVQLEQTSVSQASRWTEAEIALCFCLHFPNHAIQGRAAYLNTAGSNLHFEPPQAAEPRSVWPDLCLTRRQ